MSKTITLRKSVCLIIPGGIGTGRDNIGVPVLEALVTLLARDVDLTVVSLFKVNSDYVPNGFALVSIPAKNILIKGLQTLWHFRQLHQRKRFSAVHGCWILPSGLLAVVIGKIFGVKSVVGVLGGDAAALPSIQYGQLRTRLQKTLVLWTLYHADVRTALTQYSVNNLAAAGLKKPVRVIPWGVDADRFFLKPKPVGDPVQFLHVANLTPVKDQAMLLRAFARISRKVNAELTIIGEGPLERELRALADTLTISAKMRILDIKPYNSLPDIYQKSDILLHTSLSEGQSEVVTEAMCCGLLVCGTRVGLMADLPSACKSVAVGDDGALADGVISLLNNEKEMEDMRKNAHEWCSVHTIQWTAQRTWELYND